MKHSDKLFLLLCAAALCASVFYYTKSVPALESQVKKDAARLSVPAEGVKWKNISVPELKVNSLEWPEIKPQDEEGKWFFQVFTPPQIWIDKNGKFITESPYQKEVARQKFAFTYGGVSQEPYYITFSGYTGTEKNPSVMLKDERSGKVLRGKLNVEIVIPATNFTKAENTGITLKSFSAKRVRKSNGMMDLEITLSLFDKAVGREVEIYSFKPTILGDQRRMTLKASDGSDWIIKKQGDSIEKGESKYVVEKIDLNKEFALVRMIPQNDKGEPRLMKVSSSGVVEE